MQAYFGLLSKEEMCSQHSRSAMSAVQAGRGGRGVASHAGRSAAGPCPGHHWRLGRRHAGRDRDCSDLAGEAAWPNSAVATPVLQSGGSAAGSALGAV